MNNILGITFTPAKTPGQPQQIQNDIETEQNLQQPGVSQLNFTPANEVVEKNKQEEQGWLNYLGETGAQIGSRILERIAGFPQDLKRFAESAATGELGEQLGLPQFESPDKKPVRDFIKKLFQPTDPTALTNIPQYGSEEFKQISQELTGDITRPKDPFQKALSETAETFTDLYLGGAKGKVASGFKAPGSRTFIRKLGTAIGAQIPKEVLKAYDFDESTQELTKLGTLFTLSTVLPAAFGERSIKNVYNDLYKKRDQAIPAQSVTNTQNLQNRLDSIKKELTGIQTPSTQPVLKAINELEGQIKDGFIETDKLVDSMRRINELRGDLYKLDVTKNTRQALRRNYAKLYNSIDGTFTQWAEQNSPQALRFHKEANEIFGAFNQSRKVSNFVSKNANKISLGSGIGLLFEAGQLGLPAAGATALSGAAAFSGIKAFEVLDRIYRSPRLRQYYLDVVKYSLQEDAPKMIREMRKLDKGYKDLYEKNQSE
jgi:hypothetical protein